MAKPIQKIIFGSPGTGKSYKIDHEIIPNQLEIDVLANPENVIKSVFHPEYTHGDFMGKLLPITRSGKVEYNFYEGHFLKALIQSYRNIIKAYDKQTGVRIDGAKIENVALVIDEINRGNSSSIFGSVFQLLDRDDSGWSSYCVSVNQLVLIKILDLIDVSFSYEQNGEINDYRFKSHDSFSRKFKTLERIGFLNFDLVNRTIKIPPNLSILATMNTSDSSIYYMDSAFKRRWDWDFIDVDSESTEVSGVAFKSRSEWTKFIDQLNHFIKDNHRYIRGIEDKQIGKFFIKDDVITKSTIQSKLMFFIWDNVFARDKKPLERLMYGDDSATGGKLITFGDFSKDVDIFIAKVGQYV